MTAKQKRARDALAMSVGPAFVWGQPRANGDIVFSTDTRPGLDLRVTPDGGISTPLDADGPERMHEAIADDPRRVERTVRDMVRLANMHPVGAFTVVAST